MMVGVLAQQLPGQKQFGHPAGVLRLVPPLGRSDVPTGRRLWAGPVMMSTSGTCGCRAWIAAQVRSNAMIICAPAGLSRGR